MIVLRQSLNILQRFNTPEEYLQLNDVVTYWAIQLDQKCETHQLAILLYLRNINNGSWRGELLDVQATILRFHLVRGRQGILPDIHGG